jgi:hypothetical protein
MEWFISISAECGATDEHAGVTARPKAMRNPIQNGDRTGGCIGKIHVAFAGSSDAAGGELFR